MKAKSIKKRDQEAGYNETASKSTEVDYSAGYFYSMISEKEIRRIVRDEIQKAQLQTGR